MTILFCIGWIFFWLLAAVEETDVLGNLPDIGKSIVGKSARLKRRRATMVERGGRSAKPSVPSTDLEGYMKRGGILSC